MSAENITAFLAKAESDAALAARIKGLPAADEETFSAALVVLSGEAGLPFTVEELAAARAAGEGELSEDQLENVAGGGNIMDKFNDVFPKLPPLKKP